METVPAQKGKGMASVLDILLYISLSVHVVLMGVALRHLWGGVNVVDRLIGFDLLTTLTLAVLVLVSLIYRQSVYIDVALAVAVLSFVGSVALAKYLADDKMF
jgi:multicomponent Na+:H+ antiporter subunit F